MREIHGAGMTEFDLRRCSDEICGSFARERRGRLLDPTLLCNILRNRRDLASLGRLRESRFSGACHAAA